MKVPLFFLWLVLWLGSTGILPAEETAAAANPVLKHTSTLKFLKGTYTSIFGFVPKEYTLESVDTREILQTIESDEGFVLNLVSSDSRRILSIPDETPTVESAPKPLTGKTLRVFKKAEAWDFEILGEAEAKDEETKEARRLVARFQPGASPFNPLVWDAEGRAPVDLTNLLKFLGYPQVNNLLGSARLQKPAAGQEGPARLEFEAAFEAGEKLSKISVEIKGKGEVVLSSSSSGHERVAITGDLTIHGQRELPDGRKVPYSVVTPFSYETSTVKVPSP